MVALKKQFITDSQGNNVAVILPIKIYQKMLDELEERADIKRFDRAKADDEPSIPIDKAFEMIEQERKSKK